MKKRTWTNNQLHNAVKTSFSIRQVIIKLGLKPAGGNYSQVNKYIKEQSLDISHMKGMGWSKGLVGIGKPRKKLADILVTDSSFQSYKLKKRLFSEGLKKQRCEMCGWARKSSDGRIPVELDHINGVSKDNRIENLRILCPNCHSLQPTHRGRNKK